MWEDDEELRADEMDDDREEMELAMMREEEFDIALSLMLMMWLGVAIGVVAVCVGDGVEDGSIVDDGRCGSRRIKTQGPVLLIAAAVRTSWRAAGKPLGKETSANVLIGRCSAVGRDFAAVGFGRSLHVPAQFPAARRSSLTSNGLLQPRLVLRPERGWSLRWVGP